MAVGVGSVSLKLQDGSVKLIRNERNVPTLKRNILLLGMFDSIDEDPTEDELWHKRLSHISVKGLQVLSKQGILPKGFGNNLKFCEHCILGKATRQDFPKGQHTTKDIFEYVHSDLWSPTHSPSLSGARHNVTEMFDQYSREP
ncbi:uncharacterized mitochondrial protein AtMg00300-like [Benincasa hispida]|uniref:uncharacterized mitochondrial protein AtMg00300-like n=1 Tax=Benincasa hispida TaxID=102211 RepID=UPI001900DD66|nr:uncharacterized mitochondrial protein AtMg00300-like [Benincasa hispida]